MENGGTVKKRTRVLAYGGVIFVMLIWGLYPVFTSDLLSHYSGSAYTFASSLISAVALLLLSLPKLGKIDGTYFKPVFPSIRDYAAFKAAETAVHETVKQNPDGSITIE